MTDGTYSSATPPAPLPGQQLWSGLKFSAWLRLLRRHRFAVDRSFRSVVLRNTAFSMVSSLLGLMQIIRFGHQIARTPIREPPIFVLGFYRSGTTLLHNLLSLDARHTFANTYECFMANHFLVTEDFVTRRFPLQATRAMDNVPLTWDQPQEDEFALCMIGQPSFYLSIAFPNDPPQDHEYNDMEQVPPRARAAWKRALYRFLQAVTLKRPGRLVVKSPPHTARIKMLLELFPDARFVHIVRNPYRVYASTVKMLQQMYSTFGLQKPTFAGLEEFVLSTYPQMFSKLEEGRKLVNPAQFFEMRYEDLISNPLAQMRTLYEQLGLGGFDDYRPRLEQYLEGLKGYTPNRLHIPAEVEAEITRRWGEMIQRYGYREEARSPLASV